MRLKWSNENILPILLPSQRLLSGELYPRLVNFSSFTESHWGMRFKKQALAKWFALQVGGVVPFGLCHLCPPPVLVCWPPLSSGLFWGRNELRSRGPDLVLLEAAKQKALLRAPPSPEKILQCYLGGKGQVSKVGKDTRNLKEGDHIQSGSIFSTCIENLSSHEPIWILDGNVGCGLCAPGFRAFIKVLTLLWRQQSLIWEMSACQILSAVLQILPFMVARTLRVGASHQLTLRQIKTIQSRTQQAKITMDLAIPINMTAKERHFSQLPHLENHPQKLIYNPVTSRHTQVTNLGVQNMTLLSYSSPELLLSSIFFPVWVLK